MYQIIKVPYDFGAPTKGTDKGPIKMISALKEKYPPLIENIIEITVPKLKPVHKTGMYEKAKNLPQVKKICADLKQNVKEVLRSGKTPLILHGDDSAVAGISYGIYSAIDEPFGIIYFDSHGDLNTPETSPSGCFYGMGLAHVLGYGHPEILALNNNEPAVNEENLVLIGTRDLDPGEMDLIREKQITTYSPQEIRERYDAILSEIKNKFKEKGIRQLYLHFDQDVVDPSQSGATLYPEPGGLYKKELYGIAEFLKDNFDIIAVSISNYLPEKDKEEKTLNVILGTLGKLGFIRD
ncbi:arginase family protein [Nanoarchaeota archaeon]